MTRWPLSRWNNSLSTATLFCYAAFVALFAFAFLVMPAIHDDIWYLSHYLEEGVAGDGSFSVLEGVYGTLRKHFLYDNMRFANLTATLMLPLPHWIPMTAMAIVFAWGVACMGRLAKLVPGCPARLLLLCFLITFGLVWGDRMFTLIFASNYVWAMVLMPTATAGFISGRSTRLQGFLLGAVASCWHEGYAFPLLAGSVALLVVDRRMASPRRLWMLAGFFVGFMWWALVPGNHTRFEELHANRYNLFAFVYLWVEFAFLAIWSLMLLFRNSRRKVWRPLYIFTAVAIVAMMPLTVITGIARSSWATAVLAICALCRLLPSLAMSPRVRSAGRTAAIAAGILAMVHMVFVDRQTWLVRKSWDYVDHLFASGAVPPDTRWAFAPVVYGCDAPAICLQRPVGHTFDPEGASMCILRDALCRDHYLAFIPMELKYFRKEDAVPFNDEFSTCNFRGHLVSTAPEARRVSWCYAEYPLSKGFHGVITVPFVADDGNEYFYHYIRPDYWTSFFRTPSVVKFHLSSSPSLWFLE